MYTLPYFFAQATYGDGTYGSQTYAAESAAVDNGGLPDTGMPVIVGGTVGVSLIICAVILFRQARKNRKQ